MVSVPTIQWEGWEDGGKDLFENLAKFCGDKNFFYICGDKPVCGKLKLYGGVISLHFHYLISLETAITQKSGVFLLRIFSGNVNNVYKTVITKMIRDIHSRI